MDIKRIVKEYTVEKYTDLSAITKDYVSKYPQFQVEGTSFATNDDGTMTATVRYIKVDQPLL
jgi:hypothetical protein